MGTYWKPAKDEEIVRLYVEERLSLRTIGKLVGLSYEGVAKRLRANNVEPRRRGGPAVLRTPGKATEFDREELLRLYHVERLPLAEIADRLNLSERQVIAHATKLRPKGFPKYFRKRKLPEAWQLKVGQSIEVANPDESKSWGSYFYDVAKRLGISITVRTLNRTTVRVTRLR